MLYGLPVFSSQPHAPLCDILQVTDKVFRYINDMQCGRCPCTQCSAATYLSIISRASVTHCLLGSRLSSPTNPTPHASCSMGKTRKTHDWVPVRHQVHEVSAHDSVQHQVLRKWCFGAGVCMLLTTDLIVGWVEQTSSFGNSTVRSLDKETPAAPGLAHVPPQQLAAGCAQSDFAESVRLTSQLPLGATNRCGTGKVAHGLPPKSGTACNPRSC